MSQYITLDSIGDYGAYFERMTEAGFSFDYTKRIPALNTLDFYAHYFLVGSAFVNKFFDQKIKALNIPESKLSAGEKLDLINEIIVDSRLFIYNDLKKMSENYYIEYEKGKKVKVFDFSKKGRLGFREFTILEMKKSKLVDSDYIAYYKKKAKENLIKEVISYIDSSLNEKQVKELKEKTIAFASLVGSNYRFCHTESEFECMIEMADSKSDEATICFEYETFDEILMGLGRLLLPLTIEEFHSEYMFNSYEVIYKDEETGEIFSSMPQELIYDDKKSLVDSGLYLVTDDLSDTFIKAISSLTSIFYDKVGFENLGNGVVSDIISFCAIQVFEDFYKAEDCGVEKILVEHSLVENLNEYRNILFEDIQEGLQFAEDGEFSDEDAKEFTPNGDVGSCYFGGIKFLSLYHNYTHRTKNGISSECLHRDKEIDYVVKHLNKESNDPLLITYSEGVGKKNFLYGLTLKNLSSERKVETFMLDYQSLVGNLYVSSIDLEAKIWNFISGFKPAESVFIIDIDESCVRDLGGFGIFYKVMKQLTVCKKIILLASDKIHNEYKKHLMRYQTIDLKPLGEKETVDVLLSLRQGLGITHNVSYSDEVLNLATYLASNYLKDINLPRAAVDIIDVAGSILNNKGGVESVEVAREDLINAVNHIKGLDGDSICELDISGFDGFIDGDSIGAILKSTSVVNKLRENLEKTIFGQDEAIEKVVSSVLVAKSGLGDPQKPQASFMFVGPTGVGKTETANVMADSLGMELIRIDMSEFSERGSVSKLLGTTAGYVGYGDGGLLTSRVMKNPKSIILFDEIEKSDRSVMNLFLQILDYGFITDGAGEKVDFKDTIIIMTSNAGVRTTVDEQKSIGLVLGDEKNLMKKGIDTNQLNKVFSPEFRNRIDNIVEFNNIEESVVVKIVNRIIGEVSSRMSKHNIEIELTDEAMNFLVKNGYSFEMGVRPFHRYIKDNITKKVAEEMMLGNVKIGSKIVFDLVDGELSINKK